MPSNQKTAPSEFLVTFVLEMLKQKSQMSSGNSLFSSVIFTRRAGDDECQESEAVDSIKSAGAVAALQRPKMRLRQGAEAAGGWRLATTSDHHHRRGWSVTAIGEAFTNEISNPQVF